MRIALSLVLAPFVVLALGAAPSPARAAGTPRVFHVPPAEAEAGSELVIVADVERGWTAGLELRFRRAGGGAWHSAPFERDASDRYRAAIPADQVEPPGIEYYITAGDRPHFASAAAPHPVVVRRPEAELEVARDLERFDGRRAQLHSAAELVDFGTRTIGGQRVRDRYYRLDVDFTYRLFRFPLRAFRLGFTQMLGETPATARGDGPCDGPCEQSAGFRAGGWAELRWRLARFVDLDTRVLIQATPDGFGFGGRGELRFGDETATHFALGGEAITEVGTAFFVRLGWATVPRFPMAATVELTDYPSAHRDHGVRLIYDVDRELGRGVRIGGRVGYQARDQGIGGASGGLHATVDF